MLNRPLTFICATVATMFFSCTDESVETAATQTTMPQQQNTVQAKAPSFVAPESFSCTNILIDASRDGGVWWFPQYGAFDATEHHQGTCLAQALRNKGFRVDELPRGIKITEDLLKNYSTVIRTVGFDAYEQGELDAYRSTLDKGITLLLLADHTMYNPADELAEMLGVDFKGAVHGTVSRFADHLLVSNLSPFRYVAGGVLINAEQNKDIKVVGWLSDGSPVMGVLAHPRSNIFLMGDTNAVELSSELFVNALSPWIHSACEKR